MSTARESVLDLPVDEVPDPEEFIQAAMGWHFGRETGSPFWLERARSLDFDPRRDVRTFDDLALFPNVTGELRDVRAADLVPRGYGDRPRIVGFYESGGTTGAPKRVPLLADWVERIVAWNARNMDLRGDPQGVDWLALVPTGPHMFGELVRRQALLRGGVAFTVDMDPRWVKKCLAAGRTEEAGRYADHLVEQAAFVLETQQIGVLAATPPLLERMARDERLVALINEKVKTIMWSGVHMDPDTRHLLRTQVFPGIGIHGGYGSTTMLGGVDERAGLPDEAPCVVDPYSPYITFSVVNPETGRPVGYGERGQVQLNHLSKSMLLPHNLERDLATRVRQPGNQIGDSLSDIAPAAVFDDQVVAEGVY
ncbi:phenazine antibiotic biosynthesis protein [Streptomyces iconiensis]|uniref:Phenazine antibiotic biosynthesis protein n=1 Tax=Streptomyces iconiensis TaxID=1384038 RepID=A0ABT6ZNV7_9ACTN|nr:phenazine antibiotic biosynthesis protein [Streptomyces iconiensis]MDJ1130557.1 phenazine antibiotic biosynthesis protein [Streptomyces iconiensis]